MKFKVGDKVKVTDNFKTCSTYCEFIKRHAFDYSKNYEVGYSPKNGEIGIIVGAGQHPTYSTTYYVVLSNEKAYCIGENGLELAKESQSIIIYPKGNEVIATIKEGKKVVKSAKATCNPSDTFDFEFGAKLALDRLMGIGVQRLEVKVDTRPFAEAVSKGVSAGLSNFDKPEPKKDGNFKARCIKTCDCGLTVGKVYEFVNGFSKWNDGQTMPQYEAYGISRFGSFKDLQKWFGENPISRFEEVIEPSIRIVKQYKYEVGDKVKILDVSPCQFCEKIKKLLGKTLTVSKIDNHRVYFNGETDWLQIKDIEGKVLDATVKQVHRPAKVGEEIVITNARPSHGQKYQNGDMFRVTEKAMSNGYVFTDKYPDDCIAYEEYDVLENYTPDKPEPFRKAKVGDKIKVVKNTGHHTPSVHIGDIFTVDTILSFGVATKEENAFGDEDEEYIIIEEAKPGIKRVKRGALKDEYIEIVGRGCHGPELKIGDIHRVTKVDSDGTVTTDKYNVFLDYEHKEYVVLENYKEATK